MTHIPPGDILDHTPESGVYDLDLKIRFHFDPEDTEYEGGDPDADKWFVEVPGAPGCMSQGANYEEALVMITEALNLWLEITVEDGDPLPAGLIATGLEVSV